MFSDRHPIKQLVNEVSEFIHNDGLFEAADLVAKWAKQPFTGTRKEQAYEVINLLLHWLLNNDGHAEAAQILWGASQFTAKPESARRVWKAFDEHNFILLQGAASMSKSFSMGVRLMLEWISDPEYTTIKVLGPSENHLEDNLFTHLVQLHRGSSIPLPGKIGKLFIGLDARSRKSAIIGVVVPLGKKAAGRIQGTKRFPRKAPHPKHGKLSRLFIFLDEMANIPLGINKDIDNVMANSQGDNGLKIIGAYNPADISDTTAQRAEPVGGWTNFDPDRDFEWESMRGWWVVRLDAKYSENVQTGKIIYPGLQTKEGYELIARSSGGYDSPGFWTMARGCFPPAGVCMAVIPGGMLNKFKGEFIWLEKPHDCAGVDLALEGKDHAVLAKGKFGRATGVRMAPTMQNPEGQTIFFKDNKGRNQNRYALQLEALYTFPKADTVVQAKAVETMCKQLHVEPEWLCVDRTGNGSGVHDILKNDWSGAVQGLNFGENASETRIMEEDSGSAKEMYDRAQTELWFAMRRFIEFDCLKGAFALDTQKLFPQMTGRWFKATGSKSRVETKSDYKVRNQTDSPDEADSVTLLVHAVRKASGVILSMSAENSGAEEGTDDDYDGYYVDVTNRFHDL